MFAQRFSSSGAWDRSLGLSLSLSLSLTLSLSLSLSLNCFHAHHCNRQLSKHTCHHVRLGACVCVCVCFWEYIYIAFLTTMSWEGAHKLGKFWHSCLWTAWHLVTNALWGICLAFVFVSVKHTHTHTHTHTHPYTNTHTDINIDMPCVQQHKKCPSVMLGYF